MNRWQQSSDRDARDELFELFSPLARNVARRYMGAGEPFDDLVQVAGIGLLKAINRFDPDRGTAFSSYAVPTIVGELKRYFRDLGWSVHVPRQAQELALKVKRLEAELVARSGRSPTVMQIAEYGELGVEDVLNGLEAAAGHHAASLEAAAGDGDEDDCSPLQEVLGEDDPRLGLVEDLASIAAAAGVLEERERQVLALWFLEGWSQREIGEAIGISQMSVSRILRQAMERLVAGTREA
jgi:RNA polymerase sigma-B factor